MACLLLTDEMKCTSFNLQVVTFNIPLTMLLGYFLHYEQSEAARHPGFFHKLWHIWIPFLALVGFQTFIAAIEFPAAYGTRAFVLGPVRTGSVFVALFLYYFASKVNISVITSPHHS